MPKAAAKPRKAKPSSGWEDRYYATDHYPMIPAELGRLPSVTTITGCYPKPWMMAWVQKEARLKAETLLERISKETLTIQDIEAGLHDMATAASQKRDRAATLGNVIHDLIHDDLTHPPVPLPENDQIQAVFAEYSKWKKAVGFQLVDTERVVWSAKHLYAGKLDTVGWVDGQLTLVDFKTSARIYREMACQIAAYANAWTECTPQLYGADNKLITRLKIIRLGKELPEFEIEDFTDKWEPAFQTFLALRRVWEYDRQKG